MSCFGRNVAFNAEIRSTKERVVGFFKCSLSIGFLFINVSLLCWFRPIHLLRRRRTACLCVTDLQSQAQSLGRWLLMKMLALVVWPYWQIVGDKLTP